MKDDYIIRKAGPEDSAFIAEAIIAAEKSGTDKMSLGSLFDLDDKEVAKLLIQMLQEEISGCEFSTDSFLITEHEGRPVAAMAGWVEGFGENGSSRKLKANLLQFVFPKENILIAHSRSAIVKDVQVEREKNTLQIEYVYTIDTYRGRSLADKLISHHITMALATFPGLKKMQVQVFSNNLSAIRLYERAGFLITRSFQSGNKEILDYLPGSEKILMEKVIK